MATKKKSKSKSKSKTSKITKITKIKSKSLPTSKTVPITTLLRNTLDCGIETKDVLAFLSTSRLKGEIEWAQWEIEDRKHYLQIDTNAIFRPLSKTTKTNMRKEIRQYKSTLQRLTKIQKLLNQIQALYNKDTIKYPDRSYYPSI